MSERTSERAKIAKPLSPHTLSLLTLHYASFGAVYSQKSWRIKCREVLITLTFLRPAVDAYRVSTNQTDDELKMSPLAEMVSDQKREPQPAYCSPQLIQNQTQPNPTQPSTYPDVQQGCRIRMREHPRLRVAVLCSPEEP